ncbi:zinc finger CW-type PWWP domain protein 1 isoform X3 [Lissotriton helveticus]
MATVKNKEECIKTSKKFAPPLKKPEDALSVHGFSNASENEEDSAAMGETLCPAKTKGGDSKSSKNRISTLDGAKTKKKRQTENSDSDKKQKRKRSEAVNNASKTMATEDKENLLETNPRECSQEIKTPKEQYHLTDSQYDELFQHVLEKSIKDCMAVGAGENQEVQKRTRKRQPKKIVEGYTQITDQEDLEDEEEEEEEEEEQKPLNQCIAWIQCSKLSCEKWRKLESGIDPSSLPDSWSCSQNTDSKFNNCDIPEEGWSESDDEVIYATFVPGSIVWAKQRGYSWWPGMVEADPDIGVYFLFASNFDHLPSKYHVTFFGDSVSRAWISASMLKNFQELTAESLDLKKGKNKDYSKRFGVGLKMAEEAEKMNIQERIAKFGFSGRYRHQDESQQPGFTEEDFDVCGNDKHLTSKPTKCEPKSHVSNDSVAPAAKEAENTKDKEDIAQSKPVCGNDKHLTSKPTKCELKSHVSNDSVAPAAKEAENTKDKEDIAQSKPVCGNDKHLKSKPMKCELKSHVSNDSVAPAAKEAENTEDKEDIAQSKPAEFEISDRSQKIRKCEPKNPAGEESALPKKSKQVKDKEAKAPHRRPGTKNRFSLPKMKTTCSKPSSVPVCSTEINNACMSTKVLSITDPGKRITCLNTAKRDKAKPKATRKVVALLEGEDSLQNWFEEVKANEKELEEAFGDDMLDILTAKQNDLQEDVFSLLLNEESQEP